ncbi:MAG: FAD-dependent oxidoreductase [Burkholderiales bacterium]|nr:FAD-dependent oxidoreductase [Burkholderiales bacterium]
MDYDVAVIGAGLTGLSLALALARAGRRVAVLDTRPPPRLELPPPGRFDTRIYAIGPPAARWLEQSRVWGALDGARLSPVYDMRVQGDAAPALGSGLALSSYRAGVDLLCTIVEENEIARGLAAAARYAAGLDLLRPVTPVALETREQSIRIVLADGREVAAGLLVGADGAASWTRERAGIAVDVHDYQMSAVVANFACAKPHHGTAMQWFREEADGNLGILAWLPLPGDNLSIVWSVSSAQARALMEEDAHAFAARVAAAGGEALGALAPTGERALFALASRRARALVAPRIALVGDAAHVVHPLAGQGLNLGFGDCAALHAALEGARDCGDRGRLRAYERARKAATAEMHAVTHGLARLFAHRHPLVRALRNAGLNLAGRMPVLPELLVRGAIRG